MCPRSIKTLHKLSLPVTAVDKEWLSNRVLSTTNSARTEKLSMRATDLFDLENDDVLKEKIKSFTMQGYCIRIHSSKEA